MIPIVFIDVICIAMVNRLGSLVIFDSYLIVNHGKIRNPILFQWAVWIHIKVNT